MQNEFTRRVLDVIRSIPRGKVAFYGQVAAMAGDARQARQVAWILHSSSDSARLPWHRVVGSRRKISLPPRRGGREQRRLLEAEGVRFDKKGMVDLRKYGWNPAGNKIGVLEHLDLEKLNED